MVSHRSIGIRALVTFWQLVMVTASFWAWLIVWQSAVLADGLNVPRYFVYNEFLLVGVLFGSGGKRRTHAEHDWVVANRTSIRQTFLAMFAVFVVLFIGRDTSASRTFFFTYLPWLFLTLLISNYFLPRSLSRWSFSGDREERVALVGTSEQARSIEFWLERKNLVGFRTVGLIQAGPADGDSPPFPGLGTVDHVAETLRQHAITQVIVLDLSLGSERLRQLTQLCEETAVRMLTVHNPDHYFNHPTTTFEDDGLRFIGLRDEPLESPMNRALKRALDLVIAVPVVAFVLPMATLLVWVVQRFQSPGPVFFCQVRNGMMGRPFTMIKFRTMHLHHQCEAKQASQNDPRVFQGGRWMRKLSIDELPQFVNVLRGDMSVVGPRPYLPKHEEMFARMMRKYLIRKFIRPGISGWAQANGFRGEVHTEEDIQRRVEADIFYLENWSFSLDCLVILKTIRHCVFPPPSAY